MATPKEISTESNTVSGNGQRERRALGALCPINLKICVKHIIISKIEKKESPWIGLTILTIFELDFAIPEQKYLIPNLGSDFF